MLYIVAEGVYGTGKRIRAWAAANEVNPATIKNIHFMAVPINLHTISPEQAVNWNEVVKYQRYDYIIVDTLHMSISGADENSSKDMGQVFERARTIAGNARLFFAHHDPKDGSHSGRGSGSIRDDSDVVLRFAEKEKDSPISVLHAEKIKDGPGFKPVAVQFEQWEGDHETSLYVEQLHLGADAVDITKPPNAVDKCVATLIELDLMALGYGGRRMYEVLSEAGYGYGKNTVATAVQRLKGNQAEVEHLQRNREHNADPT